MTNTFATMITPDTSIRDAVAAICDADNLDLERGDLGAIEYMRAIAQFAMSVRLSYTGDDDAAQILTDIGEAR